MRALKCLWRFAEVEGIIEENPAQQIKVPRQQGGMLECVETDDVMASLEITRKSNPLDLRDQAIIRSVYEGGLEALARLLEHSSTEVTASYYARFETSGAK